jgi:hypothetical protein
MGAQKLGQPVPESNLVSDVNRGVPHPTQWYVPGSLVFQYFPVNARSVPASRVTWYCSGVNCVRHSAALLEILGVVFAAILFATKITFLVAKRIQLIGCVERQEVTDWNPRV